MSDATPQPTKPDDLAPADYYDPVIEAYKKDVDRTLLRENLKLSVDERLRKSERFMAQVHELREAHERRAPTAVETILNAALALPERDRRFLMERLRATLPMATGE